MNLEIKTEIRGSRVVLSLLDVVNNNVLGKSEWEDEKNLSSKLFLEIDLLLKKNRVSLRKIKNFCFDCDSPYFIYDQKRGELNMEKIESVGRCGFTTWQTGEIISKTINFALE